MKLNRRTRTMGLTLATAAMLLLLFIAGALIDEDRLASRLELRNAAPSWEHPFGTDWLGRDMLTRTVKGLTLSIGVGLLATGGSVLISLVLGLVAATLGKVADRIVAWLIDVFLSVPHLIALILLSFAFGGGVQGVILGVMLTHWPALARVVRAEVMQLRNADYVQLSRRMGRSRWWVATRHLLPHLIPQLMTGALLLFPHVILHEAALTFIGLGLSPHQPAVGIILSESMRYLSAGMWWLAFFPGLCLLLIVRAFDRIGDNLRLLTDPTRAQQ